MKARIRDGQRAGLAGPKGPAGVTASQIYPDCVKEYIGFDREMWGGEDGGRGRDGEG